MSKHLLKMCPENFFSAISVENRQWYPLSQTQCHVPKLIPLTVIFWWWVIWILATVLVSDQHYNCLLCLWSIKQSDRNHWPYPKPAKSIAASIPRNRTTGNIVWRTRGLQSGTSFLGHYIVFGTVDILVISQPKWLKFVLWAFFLKDVWTTIQLSIFCTFKVMKLLVLEIDS